MRYDLIVCGGGAAGFFAAINLAIKAPQAKIIILEKSNKILSKVKISGGGRCNVTNGRENVRELIKFYPRGGKKLYGLLEQFDTKDMSKWLSSKGVPLKTEEDLRVFPVSNDSQTIIDCFLKICEDNNIEIRKQQEVVKIQKQDQFWNLETSAGQKFSAKHVMFATGSSPKAWNFIKSIPFKCTPPVPSLFTFNIKDQRLKDLPGVSFSNSQIKIAGTKLTESGPLLITHWGLSGPAILKLSAWGANELNIRAYKFTIIVNFNGDQSAEQFKMWWDEIKVTSPKKKISNIIPEGITKRYWLNLLNYCSISPDLLILDLSKKHINKLTEECFQAKFEVNGKSTFKDEFVTCGGVSLSEIDMESMESKHHDNLYFGGEVLDIDGITGGFNFQSCWATGWAVSETLAKKIK